MDRKITMLGTGHALVTKCYNTCFSITNGGKTFLVDAGGGNGILSQAEKAGIDFASVHNMFLTHAHTDHIMGVVWVVRMITTMTAEKKYFGEFQIYCHDAAAEKLKTLLNAVLPDKNKYLESGQVKINIVAEGDTLSVDEMDLEFFDIRSTKLKQFGFKATWSDGLTLVCPGDEPLCADVASSRAKGADWLMHEAFCLDRDVERFHPYEKHHSTALDAGESAEELGVKNLILYHTEDSNLANRKRLYTADAAKNFSGNIFVPNDLETIELQ